MNRLTASLALLFLLLCVASLHAQEGAGTTFIVAFPDTTTNTFDKRFSDKRFVDRAMIYIYSAADNEAVITGDDYRRVESIKGGTFAIVDLLDSARPAPNPITVLSNAVGSSSFRIEAEKPVIVYCQLLTKHGAEAWTPLPVAAWGREYFVAAQPGEVVQDISTGGVFDYNKKAKMAPAEMLVIAAYDDTEVTIASNGDLLDAPRDLIVRLDAGEVYQVQSRVDTSAFADLQPDIGGSRITASKPIGVISGNTRAKVHYFEEGLGQNTFRNMLVEWLSPVELYGREFVYLPTWDTQRPLGVYEDWNGKRSGEYVRVYGTSPGMMRGYSIDSVVGRTDFTIPATRTWREEFIGRPVARYYSVDRPAQAFMNSIGFDSVDSRGFPGGPATAEFFAWGGFMVELVPRHRWSSFAPYYTADLDDSMEHYIDVVTDSASRNNVVMENGIPFDFNRGAIAGSGLIWGSMEVVPAAGHSLEGRNGARFTGHVYGLRRGREEYRPGGTAARPLTEYEEYLAVSYGYPLASRHVSLPSGVNGDRFDAAPALAVTPNPVTGVATITFRNERPRRALLVITNAAGREVAKITADDHQGGVQRMEWDASSLPAGLYFYRLRTSTSAMSGSILVVR